MSRFKRGEGYIDVCVGALCFVVFIVIALNIFSFLSLKATLNAAAGELIELASFEGCFSDRFDSRAEELLEGTGAVVEYSAEEYFDETDKSVQLGGLMTVTIRADTSLKGAGSFSIPISVAVTRSGISERYFKRDGA